MKLGIISESNFSLIDVKPHDWEIHSFTISDNSLSFWNIQNSAFATPARYVEEIFIRLCLLEKNSQCTPKFVFNPLFETNNLSMRLVLGTLRRVPPPSGIVILTDKNGLIAGYLFPAWLESKDSRFLTLLSTVTGKIDAELLQYAYFTETYCFPISHLCHTSAPHNHFWYEENRGIYKWISTRAIATLKAETGESRRDEALQRRDAISFTAIMPYQAGDVLFFTIAFNNIKTHFTEIVVNHIYLDIISNNAPSLAALPLNAVPNNRDENGNIMPDHIHFETFNTTLPQNRFYYYCRPSRDYRVSEFHLIDHFAFALGNHSLTRAELLSHTKPAIEQFIPEIPSSPVRVLLHFDGGWALKIYPKELQERLIDLLHAKGYELTILAGAERSHPKCQTTTFQSYQQFTQLLKSHHILVGMDSFPCHYSAHTLGLPTICLFSSTRPENSNAPKAPHYLFLEKGLACRPCYGVCKCPLYGKSNCENFVSPETVSEAITQMLFSLSTPEDTEHTPLTICNRWPESPPIEKETRQINLYYLDTKITWSMILLVITLLPYYQFATKLYREFVSAVQRKGLATTLWKATQMIYRVTSKTISTKFGSFR